MANRNVDGHQQTVTWHVDDVKVSHISPQVNDDFYKWCKKKYGNEENRHVKVKRGKIHEYLAMNLDYTVPSKVTVDMRNYVKEIINLYLFNHNSNVICPWNGMSFISNMNKKELTECDAEIFHTFIMKCMLLTKQGRPDVLTGISYLATKVLEPYDKDLKKLLRIIIYL